MGQQTPIIRTSERRTIKRCPQRWYWGWRMGLVPLGSNSDALWLGSLVHVALAKWYCGPGLKRGPHPAETFEALSRDELRFIKQQNKISPNIIEEKFVPAQELGMVMLNGYVDHWGNDDSWSVIEPERSGQVDIMDPDYPEQLLAIYAFTYDLVYRDLSTDAIWLGEHKTAAAVSTDHLPLDDQAGSYWAVATPHLRNANLIGPKETLAGINYNFLRKSLPDERPRNREGYACNKPGKAEFAAALEDASIYNGIDGRGRVVTLDKLSLPSLTQLVEAAGLTVFGEVSKSQPKPLFVREEVVRSARERATQIRRIQGEALLMDAYRHRELPLIKNPTRDCQWDCDFYNMCVLDESDPQDAAEYRKAMYVIRDPYADHRKSAED